MWFHRGKDAWLLLISSLAFVDAVRQRMAIILSKRKDFYGDMSQGSLIADEGVEGAGGGGEGSGGEGRHLGWRGW